MEQHQNSELQPESSSVNENPFIKVSLPDRITKEYPDASLAILDMASRLNILETLKLPDPVQNNSVTEPSIDRISNTVSAISTVLNADMYDLAVFRNLAQQIKESGDDPGTGDTETEMKRLTKLFPRISHSLRNKFTSVSGFSQLYSRTKSTPMLKKFEDNFQKFRHELDVSKKRIENITQLRDLSIQTMLLRIGIPLTDVLHVAGIKLNQTVDPDINNVVRTVFAEDVKRKIEPLSSEQMENYSITLSEDIIDELGSNVALNTLKSYIARYRDQPERRNEPKDLSFQFYRSTDNLYFYLVFDDHGIGFPPDMEGDSEFSTQTQKRWTTNTYLIPENDPDLVIPDKLIDGQGDILSNGIGMPSLSEVLGEDFLIRTYPVNNRNKNGEVTGARLIYRIPSASEYKRLQLETE